MKKKDRIKIKRNIKKFSEDFFNAVSNNIKLLKEYDKQDSSVFPNLFLNDEVGIESYYSTDRKHIFIIFNKNSKGFSFELVKGNVTDILDKSKTWANTNFAAFRIESSTGINLRNIQVEGMKPFDIFGDNIEILFEEFKVDMPFEQERTLDYGIILSQEKFDKIIQYPSKYAMDVILSYKNKNSLKQVDLLDVKEKMEYYFFGENIRELEIDKFIYDNPIILEVAFGLINGKSQVRLVDQTEQLKPDLKPDLIAYDSHNKMWAIVDYKLSKSDLLKKVGKVRESYRSDVTDLIAQLRDYIEFFSDSLNRKYYKDTYGDIIEYPKAIGIIGILPDDFSRGYNRLRFDFPNWVDIRPYNYIYDSFCRFIETANSIM